MAWPTRATATQGTTLTPCAEIFSPFSPQDFPSLVSNLLQAMTEDFFLAFLMFCCCKTWATICAHHLTHLMPRWWDQPEIQALILHLQGVSTQLGWMVGTAQSSSQLLAGPLCSWAGAAPLGRTMAAPQDSVAGSMEHPAER